MANVIDLKKYQEKRNFRPTFNHTKTPEELAWLNTLGLSIDEVKEKLDQNKNDSDLIKQYAELITEKSDLEVLFNLRRDIHVRTPFNYTPVVTKEIKESVFRLLTKFLPLAKAFRDEYKAGNFFSVEEFIQGEAVIATVVLLGRIITVNKWTPQ